MVNPSAVVNVWFALIVIRPTTPPPHGVVSLSVTVVSCCACPGVAIAKSAITHNTMRIIIRSSPETMTEEGSYREKWQVLRTARAFLSGTVCPQFAFFGSRGRPYLRVPKAFPHRRVRRSLQHMLRWFRRRETLIVSGQPIRELPHAIDRLGTRISAIPKRRARRRTDLLNPVVHPRKSRSSLFVAKRRIGNPHVASLEIRGRCR